MSLVDLRHYVRVYDDALPEAMCEQLVRSFEQSGEWQTVNGRGQREGLDDSAWTEMNVSRRADDAFKGFFLQQVEHALARYNTDLGLTLPVPMRPDMADLRIKRYRVAADEKFQPHFDAVDQEAGRYLVLLWYLNDVDDGGETCFIDLDLAVRPRRGRLLVFPPYWMYQHAAMRPRSADKYILSTYLRFSR